MKPELLKNGSVKPKRTLEEVMKEYGELSHEVAQKHYQIDVFQLQLKEDMIKMRKLNKEGALLQKLQSMMPKKEGASDAEKTEATA